MLSKDFVPEWIRELNKVGKLLQDIIVKIPSAAKQKEAKNIIEQIIPPEEGYVTMKYVRNVLIGLEYAGTHFRWSMLDDIKRVRNPIFQTTNNFKENPWLVHHKATKLSWRRFR